MIVPPEWTQFHATNHGTFVEVSMHFQPDGDPVMRMGRGVTLAAAVTDALRRRPIPMGRDAPNLVAASQLDFDGPEAA